MNNFLNNGLGGGEAVVDYLDSDFEVRHSGSYVMCAVTSKRIALDQLKYWSVDHQEAYIDAAASLKAHQQHSKAN
ncbi:MAG: DUF2093 domain-containing protein [Parvularculaceae bacterium]